MVPWVVGRVGVFIMFDVEWLLVVALAAIPAGVFTFLWYGVRRLESQSTQKGEASVLASKSDDK